MWSSYIVNFTVDMFSMIVYFVVKISSLGPVNHTESICHYVGNIWHPSALRSWHKAGGQRCQGELLSNCYKQGNCRRKAITNARANQILDRIVLLTLQKFCKIEMSVVF